MSERTARVWVEDIEPPTTLRFTWQLVGADEDVATDEVAAALRDAAGVNAVEADEDGLLVTIEPEEVTRYQLAAVIRLALGVGAPPETDDEPPTARVWAEDLAEDRMHVTWARTSNCSSVEPPVEAGDADERRRVAAWLATLPGARSAAPDDTGVLVRYRPDAFDRPAVGTTVRNALADHTPLRERADDLMRRSPTYGKLAQRLAMDERVSPLPDAARSAVANRARGGPAGSMARTTALRFVPGAAMISRIQTMLPVLQELSSWSRNAEPEIVEEHLSAVGLTRETLKQDTITANEIRFYARDFASEATAELAGKAAEGARKALSTGKSVIATVRESASEELRKREAAREAEAESRAEEQPPERSSGPESTSGDVGR